jgi:hypothetical protein
VEEIRRAVHRQELRMAFMLGAKWAGSSSVAYARIEAEMIWDPAQDYTIVAVDDPELRALLEKP